LSLRTEVFVSAHGVLRLRTEVLSLRTEVLSLRRGVFQLRVEDLQFRQSRKARPAARCQCAAAKSTLYKFCRPLRELGDHNELSRGRAC
jgi:hypothetical protein